VHQCLKCGVVKVNKVAVDTVQPDELARWAATLAWSDALNKARPVRGRS